MSEYLAGAAQKLGAPEELVERSARARAAAQGVDADAILAAWAGGEAPPAAQPTDTAPDPATDTAPDTATDTADPTPSTDTPTDSPEPTPSTPAAEPTPVAAAPTAAIPVPERVSQAEAADFEVVTTVATSGMKERQVNVLPRWLTALFVILPLAGLTYLITFSGGPECGSSGQLSVDRIDGIVVGCDGSLFGGGAAAGGADPGAIIAQGQAVYAQCSACHGTGGGGGVGPAFTGGAVVSTFSSCSDHIEWVRLGTAGFQAEGIATYGDAATAVGSGGNMPGFATLSDEDLRAVVFFERVSFGQEDPNAALENCGFVDPAGEGDADGSTEGDETPAGEDAAPTDGEAPAEGTEALAPAGS